MYYCVAPVDSRGRRARVGDVPDREVRGVDAKFRDARRQPCRVADQEPHLMAGIGHGLRRPRTDESGTTGDKYLHRTSLSYVAVDSRAAVETAHKRRFSRRPTANGTMKDPGVEWIEPVVQHNLCQHFRSFL